MPWLWATTSLPLPRKWRSALRISSAAPGAMPPSGSRTSRAFTWVSVSA